MSRDRDYKEDYELYWKHIVENDDGSLNKDQIMRELSDFRMLIDNLSILYDRISGGIISKPNTDAEAVLQLYEENLNEQYQCGYDDGIADSQK